MDHRVIYAKQHLALLHSLEGLLMVAFFDVVLQLSRMLLGRHDGGHLQTQHVDCSGFDITAHEQGAGRAVWSVSILCLMHNLEAYSILVSTCTDAGTS